jgi:hypothetical protein
LCLNEISRGPFRGAKVNNQLDLNRFLDIRVVPGEMPHRVTARGAAPSADALSIVVEVH